MAVQEGCGAGGASEVVQVAAAQAAEAPGVVLEEVWCCLAHRDWNLGKSKCCAVPEAQADSPLEALELANAARQDVEAVEHLALGSRQQHHMDDNASWNCQTLRLLLSCMLILRKLGQELLDRPDFQPSSGLDFDCRDPVLELIQPDLCLLIIIAQSVKGDCPGEPFPQQMKKPDSSGPANCGNLLC